MNTTNRDSQLPAAATLRGSGSHAPARRARRRWGALLGAVSLAAMIAAPVQSWAASTSIVISQVYGGGGNASAPYLNDFIELHNIGCNPVIVTGWSVQYMTAAGTGTWLVTPLSGTIPSGGYYLVKEDSGGANGVALPTPDATGTISMAATAGKVALVNSTTALSGACPASASIIDLVGYGTTATCFEGAGPAPAPSNTTSDQRALNGCTDTDVNSSNFAAAPPNPRNSVSPHNLCGQRDTDGDGIPDACDPTRLGDPCLEPDNGSGTVSLPPVGCQYLSPDDVHKIIDGLPPGTTIELGAIHKDFICNRTPGAVGVCSFPPGVDCTMVGGSLAGESECADSTLALALHGTGMLLGFDRAISLPIGFQTMIGPRTPGQPVQSFDTEMFRLFGQITGDPDFDLLRIVAGTDFGLPSPGHTTLTLASGMPGIDAMWAVDSFFDITYRIDFVGKPGGPLGGMSGSTTGTIRMALGFQVICNPNITTTATAATGAPVTYPPPGTAGGCSPVNVVCNPPSGSTFPIGTTQVLCIANDSCGRTARCTFNVTVNAPMPPPIELPTDNLPPAGQFVSATGDVVTYPTTLGPIIIKDVCHGGFKPFGPPPPLGSGQDYSFQSSARLKASNDGGHTFVEIALGGPDTATAFHSHDDGATRFFETEMLAMDLSGSSVFGPVHIRESPSRPSLGQIRMSPSPSGTGFDVSAFFDIFTDLSLDGGATWIPASGPLHVTLVPAICVRIICPPDVTVECGSDTSPTTAGAGFPTIINACGGSFTVTHADLTGGFCPKTIKRTWTVTDQWGGTDSCTQIITIVDTMAPVLTACPPDKTLTASSAAGAIVTYVAPTATDACAPANPTVSCTPASGSTFPVGPTTVTCFAQDACGNIGRCTFVVTVRPPVGDPCLEPDNGTGTVSLPPEGCQYLSPDQVHMIIAGLPPGTTIELGAIHKGFFCPSNGCLSTPPPGVRGCDAPGGSLGGEQECASSTLELTLHGTGMLAGFDRHLTLPVGFETHIAPRTRGDPIQSFDTDMFRLQGQLPPGDPDFDLLRITAGTGNGLPSPGHTTLTLRPGGLWAVDSFFDITYRIDFIGKPGRPIGGMSGSTTGTIRMVAAGALDINCPGNVAVSATSPAGAVVNYPAPTPIGGCAPVNVVCNPPSGSTFPIGATTVTCVASDGCGQSATCAFTVTVANIVAGDTFVDDSYAGLANGTPVKWPAGSSGPDHIVGADAFATMQEGVDHTTPLHVCRVAAGQYPELIIVASPMIILGPNAGIDPRVACHVGPGRVAEAVIDGVGIETAIAFASSGITLDGFTIQGGCCDGLNSGLHMGGGFSDNHVLNNIIRDNSIGVFANCAGPQPTVIRRNLFDANNTAGPAGGSGIYTDGSVNLQILENEFSNHAVSNPMILGATGPSSHVALVVSGNNFRLNNTAGSAIYALGLFKATFSMNQIASPFTGIRFGGANNIVSVENNLFTAATVGVRVVDDGFGLGLNSNIQISGNSFSGMTAFAVANEGGYSTPPLDASANWWGNNALAGVMATIDMTGGPVDFTPWLDVGGDVGGDPCDGFQGSFATLHVDDDSPQTGATGRIQEGINLVTASTVLIGPGTYIENDVIGPALAVNLIGSGSGTGAGDTIIRAANAGLPVILIDDIGGSGPASRLTIRSLRVTGGAHGIRVAATSGARQWYDFSNVAAVGNSGMGIFLDGTATLGEVQVSSSFLNNNGNAGLRVQDTLGTFAGLLVSDTSLLENGANGLSVLGTDANATSPTGVRVVNSVFLNNGSPASGGDGDVSFFLFNGDASLNNVAITADAQFPIQFRGKGTAAPGTWASSGTVALKDVTVRGTGSRPGLYIIRYSNVTGFSFDDVNLCGYTPPSVPSGFAAAMQIEHSGAAPLDLGGLRLPCTVTLDPMGFPTSGFYAIGMVPNVADGDARATCDTIICGAAAGTDLEKCVFDANENPALLALVGVPPGVIGDVIFPSLNITCPANQIAECTGGGAAVVTWPAPTTSADCPPTTVSCSPPSGSSFTIAGSPHLVTCTATDARNLSASCSFAVTVQDTTPPAIACPAPIVVNIPGTVCSALVPFSVSASDVCGSATVVCETNGVPITSPNTFPAGVTTVNCTATDGAGLTSSCNFTVIVLEPVPPMVTCVPDVTVDCGNDTSPMSTGTATAMDNCPGAAVSFTDQSPIEILPLSLGSWALAAQNTGAAAFVNGPGTPPLLTGSLHLTVGADGTGIGEGRNSAFHNTLLSSLTELSYWAYRAASPGGDNNVMIVLNVDTDGNGSDDDVIFFEPRYQTPATGNPALPNQGAIVNNLWQKWDALKGGWYSRNHPSVAAPGAGVQPLSVYLAAFPGARIVNNAGGGGVHLAAGSGLGNWQNFDGSSDTVTIGVNGVSRTYDFELTPGLDCTLTKIKHVIIRVWTATDASGNKNSCSQIIQVRDNTPPTVIAGIINSCYPTVADAEAAALAATTADDHGCSGLLAPTATTVGDCAATITVTVTDECGNSASVSYSTRIDSTAPVVTTAAGSLDRTLECSDAVGIAAALALAPSATDNCTLAPTIHLVGNSTTPVAGCPSAYVRTRTWNFTDECNNTSATFVQVITVRDTTAPVIVGTCPANITVACTHGGGEVVTFGLPTFTDNCDAAPVVTCTPGPGATFPAGITTVTCAARDNCGNVSLPCSFTVTVIDNVRPSIVCPADALVQCPNPTDPSATGSATSTDNCDLTPTITHVDAAPIEVTTATPNGWSLRSTSTGIAGYVNGPPTPPLPSGSVRLAVGNDSGALAETRLTGFDGTRLADLTELAYNSYRTTVPVGGVNEDVLLILEIDTNGDSICDDVLVFEPEWQGTPVLHATWQRWNAHSGKWWSQNNPGIGGTRGVAGVKPLSAYLAGFPNARICGAGGLSGIALRAGLVFGAWQNFDGNADFFCIGVGGNTRCYNFEATPGNQCPTLNIIVRTWTATDDSGNQTSCSQAIIVTDTVAPVIAGCTDLSVPNDVGLCSAVVNFAPTATDACSGPTAVTCTPASGSVFPVGSTTVTCTATDTCNNTGTCTFAVRVFDGELPVATCPAPITTPNDPNQCGAVVTFMANVTDNCPGASIVCSPASGSFFPVGPTTVNCTATDATGNTAGCSFLVTVVDAQRPVANCPADIVVPNTAGDCSAAVSYAATASDNCPGASIVCSPASGSIFPVGTTAVTCTATDATGNIGTCSFNVTVRDTQPPVAHCPANITVANDPGQCSAGVTYAVTATDNCPGATIACVPSSTTFPVGTTTVLCTATDAAGNTGLCSFTVTVNDTQPPVANCPANITTGNDPNQCSAVVTYAATASDNCVGASIVCVPASGSVFPLGTTTVNCTATDAASLTGNCSFTVTVNDTQAPVANCPLPITVPNDAGQCNAVVNYTATASDNCSSSLQVQIYSGFTQTGGGAPYSGLVGTFSTPAISFATDTGYNWHPFGLSSFGADITGTLVVAAAGSHTFSLNSDDGSLLFIDGNLVVNNGGAHAPTLVSGSVVLTAGTHTFEVQFFEDLGGPSGVDLILPAGVTYGSGSATIACVPPSGSTFPVGTTTVTCTATDAAGLTGTCSFPVTVRDVEPPVIGAVTATEGGNVKNCAATVVQGTVAITVPATDQCPLAPPTVVLVNGVNTEAATFVSQSPPGTFNYTWPVTAATAGGTWTATVTATDAGANTDTELFTLCVNPCQITGLVQLESFIGTGTIPVASHRVVTFKATDGLGVVLKTWTLDLTFTVGTAASGGVANYTLTDVPAGTVNLSAKTDWNKRRRLAAALNPNCQGVVNFTGATQLKGGDIGGPPVTIISVGPPDNVVNLADYSLLVFHWLELVSGVPAAAVADLNGDGAVNIFDYAILGANWFTVGDPE